MLQLKSPGLYCPSGNFHIDPMARVEHAVITHAHGDHARRGSQQYYCTTSGVGLLRSRIGAHINVKTYDYGETFKIGPVTLSFHPAGHILGSSQLRLEYQEQVWVASGDYKRDPDPTCEPFEVVKCDVFVTEATFGTPRYRWNKTADLGKEIFEWWQANSQKKINSVLFAYSLGKGQRVLGLLQPLMQEPIYCYPTMTSLNECYRAQGIALAKTIDLDDVTEKLTGALILGPQNIMKSKYAPFLGENVATAFASGWMAEGHYGYDQGFLLSDHADWDDLIRTVVETGAKQVYIQHRGQGALVRHLKTMGIAAFPVEKLAEGSSDPYQLSLL